MIGIAVLGKEHGPHAGSLASVIKVIVVGIQWKLLTLDPNLVKITNQKQYLILGDMAEIAAALNDLKDTREILFT